MKQYFAVFSEMYPNGTLVDLAGLKEMYQDDPDIYAYKVETELNSLDIDSLLKGVL